MLSSPFLRLQFLPNKPLGSVLYQSMSRLIKLWCQTPGIRPCCDWSIYQLTIPKSTLIQTCLVERYPLNFLQNCKNSLRTHNHFSNRMVWDICFLGYFDSLVISRAELMNLSPSFLYPGGWMLSPFLSFWANSYTSFKVRTLTSTWYSHRSLTWHAATI